MECYDKALYLLSLREHSKGELRDKLKAKGYNREEIDSSISRLAAEGLQSDTRFCESFLRSRLRKNPEGKAILVLRLCEKGIERDVASKAVREYFEENEEDISTLISDYKSKVISRKGEEKGRAFLYKKGLLNNF